MKTTFTYTDENSRLRDLGNLISSPAFQVFVDQNCGRLCKWKYGMDRVQVESCKTLFGKFLLGHGFSLDKKTKHANGIGNNNENYIQDLESGEFIGSLHLNSDLSGNVYCGAADIHGKSVSSVYRISRLGISVVHRQDVDWLDYTFGQVERARNVIEYAIEVGVLKAGSNGGVLVYKAYENGTEDLEEVSLNFAAKEILEHGKLERLIDAVEERKKQSLDAQIHSASSQTFAQDDFWGHHQKIANSEYTSQKAESLDGR